MQKKQNSEENVLLLKPKKEIVVLRRHPWIFSGAVESYPTLNPGAIVKVVSHQQEVLGWAYFNPKSNIIGRMVSFNPHDEPSEIIPNTIRTAIEHRNKYIPHDTNAYRLINAEGDFLSGLIVDKYADYLVVQIQTLGMELQREIILKMLVDLLQPKGIYEKSTGTSRRREGLQDRSGVVYGDIPKELIVLELGLKFHAPIFEGQKTGLFLDQRAMRQRMRELAVNKSVLNCFCYTGGFSVFAAAGGANKVDSVDISAKAIEWTRQNLTLNQVPEAITHCVAVDVFQFIKDSDLNYDIIILDPPAFAKKQDDIKAASKGYRDLNKIVLKKAKPGTLVVTCSCSQPITTEMFKKILFEAALEAGRNIQILESQRHGIDHPVNLFHPEGEYLKGVILLVN